MDKPASVDDYFSGLDDRGRAALAKLRAAIAAAAPAADEGISYDMPAFRTEGRGLVCYAAFKDHYSLFPMGTSLFTTLKEELEPYQAGKGTIQFRYEERLPVALVKKVVKERLKENAARSARKR